MALRLSAAAAPAPRRASRLDQCTAATMHASGNAATDDGQKARFKWLHGLSVLVSLAHIAVSGGVLARFV
jgi:hypothetical protein